MIGVLALQGGFAEHIHALHQLGSECFEIRKRSDFEGKQCDGLILPGGESTVMGKLLHHTGLFEPLKERIDSGIPVFGTCAGLILLAQRIQESDTAYFNAIDITAKRNAYGRQLGSFHTYGEFGSLSNVPMTFIRAPYMESVGDGVEVLTVTNGQITAARQKNVLVTAFHPELTSDLRVHDYFLKLR